MHGCNWIDWLAGEGAGRRPPAAAPGIERLESSPCIEPHAAEQVDPDTAGSIGVLAVQHQRAMQEGEGQDHGPGNMQEGEGQDHDPGSIRGMEQREGRAIGLLRQHGGGAC